jgi:endonuclease YncB( thermonuclease family)
MGCFSSKITPPPLDSLSEEQRRKKLLGITLEDTHQFSFNGMTVSAKIVSVYDGDTFRAAFYYKDEIIQLSCRCLGYDAPEIKMSLKNPDREVLKKFAYEARDRFKELLDSTKTGLVELNFSENDMYGRPLTKVYVDGKYINQMMMDEGYGKPYSGGHKNEWTSADCVKKN